MNCIEWSQNGEDIFCGFSSGRVVHFHVKFKSDVMKHIPLYPEQCGSEVVQLSISEGLLLVSTLDRTFLLDVNTNKLDQVKPNLQSISAYYHYIVSCRLEERNASLECMVDVLWKMGSLF